MHQRAPMLSASLASFSFILLLRHVWSGVAPALSGVLGSARSTGSGLARASALFRELEELLSAGLLPSPERWAEVGRLDAPWGRLADHTLGELRSRGGQVLPTLKRLRALVDSHARDLLEGRARSSAALSQALTCAAMVPCLSSALYLLLPGLSQHRAVWFGVSVAALAWAGVGALWLVRMAESARWGGIQGGDRPALLAAYCACERILALLRSGNPPDLAWAQAVEEFQREKSPLGKFWTLSLWATDARPELAGDGARALARAGDSVRRSIQCALLEGRPSAERVEAAVHGLRHEMTAAVERELSLLSTRALKPLFFCVAPGLFALIGCAVVILLGDSSGGEFLGF